MRHIESNLQIRCVNYFRYNYPEYAQLFFSVPNGGYRRIKEAGILKAEGLTAGVSDTLLLVPSKGYHGFCIEFKKETYPVNPDTLNQLTKKGSQSKEQKTWQKAVEQQGYKYAVVYRYDQFVQEIEDYLGAPIDYNKTNLDRILNDQK